MNSYFLKLRNKDINAKIVAVKDSTYAAADAWKKTQASNPDLCDTAAARIQLEWDPWTELIKHRMELR